MLCFVDVKAWPEITDITRTSHPVHLTLGPFDNALIRCYLVAHICGRISKDTLSGRIRERFVLSKSRWLKVLPIQAMAKDCRWNKLLNHLEPWVLHWSKIKQRGAEVYLFKNSEFGDLAWDSNLCWITFGSCF